MKIYNKLVRDNIPEIMVEKGVTPVTRVLDDKEYIEEVLLAILRFNNISKEEFEQKRQEKVKKRGAFNKKIFLIKEL